MDLNALVKYIRNTGCSLRLYNRDELKTSKCVGTFDLTKSGQPLICLATKGNSKLELCRILLHEYAHFLQWHEGFLSQLTTPHDDGWDILDRWLAGEKFTPDDIKIGRISVLLIEYDAEMRTIELANQLNVDIGSQQDYLNAAYAYLTFLKWVFLKRHWGFCPGPEHFLNSPMLYPCQVLCEITQEEIKIIDSVQEMI